jgi:hypothetical protein
MSHGATWNLESDSTWSAPACLSVEHSLTIPLPCVCPSVIHLRFHHTGTYLSVRRTLFANEELNQFERFRFLLFHLIRRKVMRHFVDNSFSLGENL